MITQNVFKQIEDPKHPLHYLLLRVKCPIFKRFCGLHIHISFHWQSYPLWTVFCAILRFQEVLEFLLNNNFHVCVCYWITDCQWLTVIFVALYHFNHYSCIPINSLCYLIKRNMSTNYYISTSSGEALTRYEDKLEVVRLSDCPYRSSVKHELTTISEHRQDLT